MIAYCSYWWLLHTRAALKIKTNGHLSAFVLVSALFKVFSSLSGGRAFDSTLKVGDLDLAMVTRVKMCPSLKSPL